MNSLEKSLGFLRNQVGGTPPPRPKDMSDAEYKDLVDSTAAAQIELNTHADAHAKVAMRERRAQLQAYLQDPAVEKLNQQAAQSTFDMAKTPAMERFLKDHPEVQEAMQEDGLKFPDAVKKTGTAVDFQNTFNYVHGSLQQQWLHQNGAVAGGAAATLAGVKAELTSLDAKEKNLNMMPGENGRMVPRIWASRADNEADTLWTKKTAPEKVVGPPVPEVAAVPTTNPFVLPALPAAKLMPGFDASGTALNTAPVAQTARMLRDASYFLPREGGVDFNGWTEQDKATAAAANPGFGSGMVHAPGYWVRKDPRTTRRWLETEWLEVPAQ